MSAYPSHQQDTVSIADLLERIALCRYPALDGDAGRNDDMFDQWFDRGAAQEAWSQCIREECLRGAVAVRVPDSGVPARPDVLDESQWLRCVISEHNAVQYIRRFGHGEWPSPSATVQPDGSSAGHSGACAAAPVPAVCHADALTTVLTAAPCPTDVRGGCGTGPVRKVVKLRRNVLDPIIEEALAAAGGYDYVAVFSQLKELALRGDKPFSGLIENGKLHYTTADDKVAHLTLSQLRDRLRRRKQRDDARQHAGARANAR